MENAFSQGKLAKQAGKSLDDNPHVVGFTKLGSPKLSEEGVEWEKGFYSVQRWAGKQELADAEAMDITKFRRKSNRYYNS